MSVNFRNYSLEPFFTEDYVKVRDFLIRVNQSKLTTPYFVWGGWEWLITHGGLDHSGLGSYGLWEDDGRLVAFAVYETTFGEAFFVADEGYGDLKPEVIAYAKKHLHKDGKLRILLPEGNRGFQRAAVTGGFRPTQNRQIVSAIDIGGDISYSLPEGYSIVSMADGWDWQQYNRVMWRGFNHEGKANHDDEAISVRKQMLSSPMVNPELVIAVLAPDGNYVSHCGMWYRPGDDYAYVEPVATDPDYRMMGLGKAAVLEAVKRCGKLGAGQALVSSSQQFYYNIGFYPIHTGTWWEQIR